MALLEVKDLTVDYGATRVLRGVSFSVARGEIVGVIGESGSGKSTLCGAAIRALSGRPVVGGEVLFDGQDVYGLNPRELQALYGSRISMVRQNPMSSLDPFWTVGNQVREVLARRGVPRGERAGKAIDALRRVRLTAPEMRVTQFPHQLSGGMLQRTLIAMSTAAKLDLLLADEPTSALDASISDEILMLLRELRDRDGTAVVLVTHHLDVVRRICDRLIVMYAGEIVEEGRVADVFAAPRHPYTRALMAATPHVVGDEVVMTPIPGQVPMPTKLPSGCSFSDRCSRALQVCSAVPPPRRDCVPEGRVLCHLEESVHGV